MFNINFLVAVIGDVNETVRKRVLLEICTLLSFQIWFIDGNIDIKIR